MTAYAITLPDAPDAPTNAWVSTGDRPDLEHLLLQLHDRGARVVDLAGNKPILLDDPATVRVVCSGHVEVFAVRLDEGRPVGARRHLFRVGAGAALFGIDLSGQTVGLLASGAPGTRILCAKRAVLAELARLPECAELVAVLVEQWTAALCSGLEYRRQVRDVGPLDAGQIFKLTGGARVHVLGKKPTDTQATRVGAEAWEDLDRAHHRALVCLAAEEERRRCIERLRHEERTRTDHARMQSAVGLLVQSLAARRPQRWAASGRQDPLFEASRLVGEALGISVKPVAALSATGADAPIEAIARASRVHTRRVALRGAWWKRASGPLVGYRSENHRPVALLPKGGRYELHDPADGSVTAVTLTVATSVAAFADTFYPQLGDGPVTARSPLMFGLHGGRGDLLCLLALSGAVGMLGLLTPIVTGLLFDSVIPGGHRPLLLQLGAWLAAVALIAALFQVARDVAVLRLSGRVQATAEPAIVDRLLDLPVAFFQRYMAGDLAGRLLAFSTVREILTGPVLSAVLSGLFGMLNLVLLFLYEPGLAVVATGLVVVLVAVVAASSYRQMRYQRQLGERSGRLAGTVLHLINGISKLRAAGAEGRAFGFWAERFAGQRQVAYQARLVANGLAVFTATYPVVASMVLFGVVALAGEFGLSVGAFLAFNAAFGQFMGAAIGLVQASTAICQVAPAYERARPILLTRPEADAPRVDPGELRGAIEINRISFRYGEDGPLILDDVSLHCRPGELVALVGPSGSGKSTLLRLLLGFEAPDTGAILYDGRDLAVLDPRAVRRQIGTVLQSGRLLAGDIFTNIVGASTLTLDDAWDAARLAGLDEDIRQLPMRMHTLISAGAGTLSGGQQQRLMIARAIVHKPKVLFLDEATSALDNRTQEVVIRSLEQLSATRLVIAHRLSTVVNADRIYVLERGRVVEAGTFAELMERRGLFAALARRQTV